MADEDDALPEDQETEAQVEDQETETETDESEDQETEEQDEGQETEQESEKPSRGENRHAKLSRDNAKLREELAAERARAEERERLRVANADNGRGAREREERLAVMSPEERTAFLATEKADNVERQLQLQSVQMADMRDEAKYDAVVSQNTAKGRVYAKHKEWVENALAQARQKGNNPSREALLRWKLGEDALSAKPTPKQKAAKQAAGTRVAEARAAGTSVRGDAGVSRKGEDDLETIRARILKREREGATQ